MAEASEARVARRPRMLGKIITLVVAAAIVSVAAIVYSTRSKPSQYQTAFASKGSVIQSLVVSGTIAPTISDSVYPPTSGAVSSVSVTLGQTVQAGAVLATVTPSVHFEDQIAAAQASLAQAEATLAQAQYETTSTTTSTTIPINPTTQLIVQINQSITQLKSVCSTASCQTQLSALTSLVQQLQAANKNSAQNPPAVHSQVSVVPSSTELAADQAIVTADQAAVANAQASVPSDAMTSPIAGIVAALPLSVGQGVAPTSTADSITVIAPSSWQAQVNVLANELPSVKLGDPATVVVAGQIQRSGTISAIGTSATTDPTTGNVTFPVTINLTGSTQSLYDGSSANVTIQTSKVSNVVTVPTSAISRNGNLYQVDVLTAKNKSVTTTVNVGAVGPSVTQILSGVTPGETVILANLSTPLPTPTVQLGALRRAFAGGGGGRGGGGGGAKAIG